MSTSSIYNLRSPDLSKTLRYERVARLEAALKLRDKRQRARNLRRALMLALVGAAFVTLLVLW
ncbi:MAG: hypothetical protein RIK87_12930 [Fuerstiella sp.]